MRDCAQMTIPPHSTIREAAAVMEASSSQIALVADADDRLLGTITDGDIRRAMLRGQKLTDPAATIMNDRPVAIVQGTSGKLAYELMLRKNLRRLPVVSESGRLLGLEVLEDFLQPCPRDNAVVIMAGGLGRRLAPLTDHCPKPLLKVGSKPLLETIVESLRAYSFHRFYFSVHYKAEMIEDYFGDGSRFGVQIDYLREHQPLGTAGALSLLPDPEKQPVIVINGDLLTSLNYSHLLQFHQQCGGAATMCVREYTYSIPYGVVETDQHRFVAVQEKPAHQAFVNAGIYVLEPPSLQHIAPGKYMDMPDLFEQLKRRGLEASVFPVREYWLDIGRLDDYERANREYGEVFR